MTPEYTTSTSLTWERGEKQLPFLARNIVKSPSDFHCVDQYGETDYDCEAAGYVGCELRHLSSTQAELV